MKKSRRHALGQHFLVNRGVLKKIIRVISPGPDDLIIEIGPGRGELTFPLAEEARKVIAIEKDGGLAESLRSQRIRRLTVLEGDVLKVDFRKILSRKKPLEQQVKLVGNLPYSISSPLLFRVLREKELFGECVFLLQKEVAERICAGPGSKAYAPLSILFRIFFDARLEFTVSPGSFSPPPRVESALVSLRRRPEPLFEIENEVRFQKFLRVAFANQYILGTPQPRTGNRFKVGSWIVPGNIYHCKPFGPNDYCYIYSSRAHNKHWESLLKAMGREDLLGDARFSTHAARAEHHEEVDQLLAEWARGYTKHEVMQMLGEAGVPTGAVLDTEELLNAPDMRERGVIATINHPVRGELAVPGWPVRMSGSPVDVVSAPLLGQHNVEVYGEWLGIPEEEVARLREEKVI